MVNNHLIQVRPAVVFMIELESYYTTALVNLLEKKHGVFFHISEDQEDTRLFCDGLQTPQDVENVKGTIRSFLNLMSA